MGASRLPGNGVERCYGMSNLFLFFPFSFSFFLIFIYLFIFWDTGMRSEPNIYDLADKFLLILNTILKRLNFVRKRNKF